jgi:hypothetical protein
MNKLNLTGWAAISDIVGTIAVVISLIFVVVSIDQNTVQLQAQNDDFLIQLQDEAARDIELNPDLAAILLKFARQDELTDIETLRYQMDMSRWMNRWEVAFAATNKDYWIKRPGKYGIWILLKDLQTDFHRRGGLSGGTHILPVLHLM